MTIEYPHYLGKIITTKGTILDFTCKGLKPTHQELQLAVGGYFTYVTIMQKVMWFDDPAVMIINEEGHVKGLPVNMKASHLVTSNIAGDVIILPRRLVYGGK